MSSDSSHIPVGDDGDDDYSYDSDDDTLRTLASTVRAYRYQNNRRYHEGRTGTHPFPNDKKSANNEEIAHLLFLKLFNDKPYIAPIEAPRNIIDLGTGTGLWASLVADWFDGSVRPLANVIGVDLAPQQESSVQTNLTFEVDDITNEWTTNTLFDLVHIRMLWGVINDWPKVYAESFKHMESGGYLQFADIDITPRCDDGTMPDDTIFNTWKQAADAFMEISRGRFFDAKMTKKEMEDAGFVEIEEKRYKLPLSAWSSDPRYRELGRFYGKYWETGIEGWLLAPATQYLNWSIDKVKKVLEETQDTLTQRKQHVYHYFVVIYAKKP